VPDNPRPSP